MFQQQHQQKDGASLVLVPAKTPKQPEALKVVEVPSVGGFADHKLAKGSRKGSAWFLRCLRDN